ncbi:MAG: TraB/GumN family protein, partial [Bacteroidales bacterium]|nr:TraB/GumN family protein [Bacteroidales bacterium]
MKSTKQILFSTISIIIMMLIFSVSLFAQNTNDTTATNDTTTYKGKQKKYQALLWEITGNGLSKPSYLYGSMHVSKKVAFHLGDTFFMALRNVDVVALESNPGEWMEKYSTSEYYQKDLKTYNKYASSYSYRSFYQTAFQIDLPEKDDFSYLLGRSYDVMNSMLYRKYDYSADFEETTYLDLFIYQAGKKLGKQVVSLEDFEEARKLVDKASKRPKKKE